MFDNYTLSYHNESPYSDWYCNFYVIKKISFRLLSAEFLVRACRN